MPELTLHPNRVEPALCEMRPIRVTKVMEGQLRQSRRIHVRGVGRVDGDEEAIARTAFDLQLIQKVLPKLNGGRELELPLTQLLAFCLDGARRKKVETGPLLDEARKRLAIEPVTAMATSGHVDDSDPSTDDSNPSSQDAATDVTDEAAVDSDGADESTAASAPAPATYPRAARELVRMLTRLRTTGFVAFLE
jgi:hypothetical protein